MNVEIMKQDVVSKILECFNENGIESRGNNFEDCILQWMDICDKRIAAKKRKVVFSKELQEKINNNSIDSETIRLINVFKSKFEEGNDICPYLSKNIKKPTSIDYLLTIWRIHHLHLNEKIVGDMCERSDKYILFMIHNEVVYFLDLTKHLSGKEFASRYLLNILENNNWLDYVSIYRSSEIKNVSYEITSDEEMFNFWKSNINYFVYKLGESYYTNINGLTCAGTSLNNQLNICNLNKSLFRASQNDSISYSRTKIDIKMLKLTIYIFANNKEQAWITIEGE